jgi:hypothetical protein
VPSESTSRARLLGVLAFLIGLVGAVVLWVVASQRYDNAVADLAPAPVGCDTTLVFDRTGTYTFFVETEGEVGEIDGDCDSDDRQYSFDGDETPRVELRLVDDAGEEVDLDRASGPSYDRGGSSGSGVRTADIEETGAYLLRVDSEADDVMVRVGGDPSSGVVPMRVGAIALLVAGLVLGGIGLARSRRPPAVEQPSGRELIHWPPVGQPLTPPTAPPYANPPVPPPYAGPPAFPPPGQPGRARGGPLPPPSPPTG